MTSVYRRFTAFGAMLLVFSGSASVRADEPAPADKPPADTESADPWLRQLAEDPDDPLADRYAKEQKERLDIERELKLIRAHHFRGIRKAEIRQEGIDKLKPYTANPTLYPMLLSLFEREGDDVRLAILDQFVEQKTDVADASIAWAAVFGRDKSYRGEAATRLLGRISASEGTISNRVKSVVAAGLKHERTREVSAAADLAWQLRLFEAIPMLINAQVVPDGNPGGGDGEQEGAIADIVIGTQQAFVADLQPVVGDSAVGFDPELGVVTDGVVLRVMDAYVLTYRMDVHNSLNKLAAAGWGGQSVAHLGWDQNAWKSWYYNEFKPYRASAAVSKTP